MLIAILPIGLFPIWVIYRSVGRKVESLSQNADPAEGDPVQSLIVNGLIQAPGVVFLQGDSLYLHPIIGKKVEIPLIDIDSVSETTWFNGKGLIRKTGFWLEIEGRKRLGFAVSDSSVPRFRDSFRIASEG